jgi:WD40 repeat protein
MDLKTGKLAFELRLNTKLANTLPKISHIPSDQMLVTLSSKNDKGAALQFWNEQTGTLVRSIPLLMEPTTGRDWNLTVHPGSRQVVVTRGTQMKIWRSVRGQLGTPIKVQNPNNEGIDFVDSASRILKKTTLPANEPQLQQKTFEILELKDNKQLKACELVYSTKYARQFQAMAPNGREFAAWAPFPTGAAFKFFELQPQGQTVERLTAQTKGRVDLLKISPSNLLLWTGSEVYETKTGSLHSVIQRENMREPSSGYSGNWVGDSKVLAIAMIADSKDPSAKRTGANRFIVLWDAHTGKVLKVIEAPNAVALSVSPDGRHFAEATRDMRVRIHNTNDLVPERALRVHDSPVISVAWHPKLPLLATSSEDSTVKIWDLDSEQFVEQYGTFHTVPTRVFWSPDGTGLGVQLDQEAYIYTPKCAVRAPK